MILPGLSPEPSKNSTSKILHLEASLCSDGTLSPLWRQLVQYVNAIHYTKPGMNAAQRIPSHNIHFPSVSAAHGCLSWPSPFSLILLAPSTETVTRCSAPVSLFGVPEDIYRLATETAKCFCSNFISRLALYPWKRSVRVTFSTALWLKNVEAAEAGLQSPLIKLIVLWGPSEHREKRQNE